MNAENRVVLVTGASKGIGREIASQFAEQGYRVAGTYRSGDVPEGVLGVKCDITIQDDVEAAFSEVEEKLGPVEVLIANAGITKDTLLIRMSDEDFSSVLDTNLTGTFRVVRRAARQMMRARYGRIVLISSVVGLLGSAGQINYAASKSALIGMARSLARELGPRNVTCNVLAPGFVETEMTANLPEDLVNDYRSRIPLGRFADVADVARVAQFLASPAADYITGAIIPVDGGMGMGH